MKILVIGGTQFVGRAVVEQLLANGDEVTLFHRGRTNPELFAVAHHIFGDRNEDLSGLTDGQWDATIDSSAYFPRQVHSLAAALGDRGGRYVHVSSVSAYDLLPAAGANEDSPLATLDDPNVEEVIDETYGGLKALCERATHDAFGPGGVAWSGFEPSIVRPTYVAGPHDHTGRFTWWVKRIARGGKVLAPGPRDNPFQSIDVRDVANFVGRLAQGTSSGVFHLSGPVPPYSFEDFLTMVVAEVGPPECELMWIDAQELLENGLSPGELPLWEALGEDRHVLELDSSRAIEAGLQLRPLSETIRDVYAQELAEPTLVTRDVGIGAARERELLELLD
jgi:2'-hydroxyisoflavone reductase